MNIYKLLKIFHKIPYKRLKLAALWGAHVSGRRYVGVFLDPVMACNLRCRMCYMSNPEQRPKMAKMTPDDVEYVTDALMPSAIKQQIGCATEPTLYTDLPSIVDAAHRKGVPYISITTNGQLLSAELLEDMIEKGLNEVTLSVHGFTKQTYEHLMVNGKWERFTALVEALREAKKRHPEFKLRVNYVMNAMNFFDLTKFFYVFPSRMVDILQLRPVQDTGGTGYTDFDLSLLKEHYAEVIQPLVEQCVERGAVCMYPTREELDCVDGMEDEFSKRMEQLTYYYVSPGHVGKEGWEWGTDSFGSYHRRKHSGRQMFRGIFSRLGNDKTATASTKKLNYKIK